MGVSVGRRVDSGQSPIHIQENVGRVSKIVENNKRTPAGDLFQQVQLSVHASHAILHKNLHLYPCRTMAVQKLLPPDFPRHNNIACGS